MAFNPGATKRQKEAARRDYQRRKEEKPEQGRPGESNLLFHELLVAALQ